MICKVRPEDFDALLNVINDAAQAYRGVIPNDRWKEPYMSREELRKEIGRGVEFYGYFASDALVGVMGIQHVKDVTLIRHAYVLTHHQKIGIGQNLLKHLLSLARTTEIMAGTWENASWAVRFYQKHDFKLVSIKEKRRLLRKYWDIPERQIETSVVLRFKKQDLS